MLTAPQKKLLLLSSLGGVLEFYDFIIYALLARYLTDVFFPADNPTTSLLATFATFSVGYLVRPLGGILFGHFGDRLGRKKTFTLSILMMAVATFCIGCVPSHATIGIAAPIIVTFFRILQGLSVGGEIPGAIAYVSESIPHRKGLGCGIIFFALINGIVLGSIIEATFSTILSHAQMVSWGWRIPFLLGGTFGFFSYHLRRQLEESSLFKAITEKVEAFPFKKVLQYKLTNALSGAFIVGLGASIITLLFLFTPAYLSKILNIDTTAYIWYNTAAIFLTAVLCIVFGAISDKISHKKLIALMCLLTLLFIYPIFIIYVKYSSLFLLSLFLSTLLTSLAWGVIPSFLSDLFPTQIRYSGIGISYNLGFAIFGGLTPLIAMVLIDKTHLLISPIFYLIGTALLASISLLFVKPTLHT